MSKLDDFGIVMLVKVVHDSCVGPFGPGDPSKADEYHDPESLDWISSSEAKEGVEEKREDVVMQRKPHAPVLLD